MKKYFANQEQIDTLIAFNHQGMTVQEMCNHFRCSTHILRKALLQYDAHEYHYRHPSHGDHGMHIESSDDPLTFKPKKFLN